MHFNPITLMVQSAMIQLWSSTPLHGRRSVQITVITARCGSVLCTGILSCAPNEPAVRHSRHAFLFACQCTDWQPCHGGHKARWHTGDFTLVCGCHEVDHTCMNKCLHPILMHSAMPGQGADIRTLFYQLHAQPLHGTYSYIAVMMQHN